MHLRSIKIEEFYLYILYEVPKKKSIEIVIDFIPWQFSTMSFLLKIGIFVINSIKNKFYCYFMILCYENDKVKNIINHIPWQFIYTNFFHIC